jgi:SpoIIAA-like
MPANIQLEPDNVYVLRFSGIVKRSEFGGAQTAAARAIDAGAKPRILAILEDFDGWEKGADWNDLDFMLSHGNEIAKIAIVGEPRWEPEALAFAGAGFRSAPVKFFPPSQLAEARAWIGE